MEEEDTQLGFLEKFEPGWNEARFFPSKVGGFPAWINPQHLPSSETLKCVVCSEPLCFLMQMYAPLNASESSHFRTLYVFCCRRGKCLKESRKSLVVLRGQLAEENPFFEASDADLAELDEVPEEDEDSACYKYRKQHSQPLCDVCGQAGTKRCANCKCARYCSATHQQLHWKLGKHSIKCSEWKQAGMTEEGAVAASAATPQSGTKSWLDETNPFVFTEFEIITENESDVKRVRNAQVEEKQKEMLDKYYKELEEEEKSGEVDTTEFKDDDMPKNQHDEEFIKFQTTIDVDGTQVVRYTTAPNAQPLWMMTKGKLDIADVPKCALCGSERVFELQILPQIIYHLKVQRNLVSGDPDDEIDFGVLTVYTCKNSCQVDPNQSHKYSSGAYAIEYIYQQKLS